jgi:hypothetical protein
LRRIIIRTILFVIAVCPLTCQTFTLVNPGEIDIINAASSNPAMTSTEGLAAGSIFRVRTFGLYYSGDLTEDDSISLRLRNAKGERDLTTFSPSTFNDKVITALVPEDTAIGEADVVVATTSGKSFSRHVWIVPSNVGLFNRARNYTDSDPILRNQLTAPILPGHLLTLRGTGLGQTIASNVEVEILGLLVRADSAGRVIGETGVDQITFRFPEGIPDDCYVPIKVRVSDRMSNQITVAKGELPGPCHHPLGLSLLQLQALDSGDSVNVSRFLIESAVIKNPGTEDHYIRLDSVQFDVVDMLADGVAIVSGARDPDNPFSACSISASVLFPDSSTIGIGVPLTSQPAVRLPDGQEWELKGGFLQSRVDVPEGSSLEAVPPSILQGGDWFLRLPGSTIFDTPLPVPPPLRWTNRADLQVIPPKKDATISWESQGYATRDRVAVKLSSLTIASTGWRTVSLGCRAPAVAGSITIPAALITQFVDQAGNDAQMEVSLGQSNREWSTYSVGGTIPGVLNVTYLDRIQTRIE